MTRLIGAHVPVTGGVFTAPARAVEMGATAMQVFTRNQMMWKAREMSEEEARAFRKAYRASGVGAALAHASYLVNLAATNPRFLAQSRDTLAAEVARCHALGIPHVVVHPGAHLGAGEAGGHRAVADSVNDVLARTQGMRVTVLLEVTAGQGSCLGHRFEHVAAMLEGVTERGRVGVCLDTCHLWAAGYDLATPRGYERTIEELDAVIGLRRVQAVHLNDSRRERGCRVDRHARAGEGLLGLAALARIVNDERLAHLPMVVETPGPIEKWKAEIATIRGLIAAPRARRRKPAGPSAAAPARAR
ncbi:MAG TPA: deoxyribonuclease IV [Vicinamibacteria bacterium]